MQLSESYVTITRIFGAERDVVVLEVVAEEVVTVVLVDVVVSSPLHKKLVLHTSFVVEMFPSSHGASVYVLEQKYVSVKTYVSALDGTEACLTDAL